MTQGERTPWSRREFVARSSRALAGLVSLGREEPSQSASPVALVKNPDKSAALKRALELMEDLDFAQKGIYLKPDFNSPHGFPASTDPDMLRDVVTQLRERNCGKITVAERSGMGITREMRKDRHPGSGKASRFFSASSRRVACRAMAPRAGGRVALEQRSRGSRLAGGGGARSADMQSQDSPLRRAFQCQPQKLDRPCSEACQRRDPAELYGGAALLSGSTRHDRRSKPTLPAPLGRYGREPGFCGRGTGSRRPCLPGGRGSLSGQGGAGCRGRRAASPAQR